MRDSKGMLKLIGKIALFLAILAVIMLTISKVIGYACMKDDSIVHDRNKSVYRIAKQPDRTLDMVVLGDSLTYYTFSPMQMYIDYGIAGFVCGQPGQKIQESYIMLEHVFECQSPKLVILETDNLFMWNEEKKLANIKDTVKEWLKDRFDLVRSHDTWKSLFVGKEYPEENYKGLIYNENVTPMENVPYMIESDETREVLQVSKEYAQKIKDLCDEHGAKLLFVSAPSLKDYNYPTHNGAVKYAKELGVPYLDFNLLNNETGIDWMTDTFDYGDHLNISGATKVSKYLAKYIKDNYDLPDHRGEAEYADWDEEAKIYAKRVNGLAK